VLFTYTKGLIFTHTTCLVFCFFLVLLSDYSQNVAPAAVIGRLFQNLSSLVISKNLYFLASFSPVISLYLTLCQLFSIPCTTIFLFSVVPSPEGPLEAFWHGEVKGIGCSCSEDVEWGKERVI